MLVLFVIVAAFPMHADEPFALSEPTRPSMFLVDHNRIFVLDRATVYVYSLDDHKLIRKFGKIGEGPTEFRRSGDNNRPLSMCIYNKQIIVNSEHRITYFDMDGKFIKMKKVPVDRLLFPVEGKFVGIGLLPGADKQQYLGYTLHDTEFKSEKTIFLSNLELNNPRKLTLPLTSFTYNPAYKNKFYISASSDEFKINVYDKEGNKEYEITKNYPKKEIPSSYKKEAVDYFGRHPRFKEQVEFIKRILFIREHFPPIRDLIIVDDFIYALTFKRKGEQWELIKMDLKGNEKGRIYITLSTYEHFTFYPILYTVNNGTVYTLAEDEEDETWMVHSYKF